MPPKKITDPHIFERKHYHHVCTHCGLEKDNRVHVEVEVDRVDIEMVVQVVETLMAESGRDFQVTPEVQQKALEMFQAGFLPAALKAQRRG